MPLVEKETTSGCDADARRAKSYATTFSLPPLFEKRIQVVKPNP
jgi:hypothetical protein